MASVDDTWKKDWFKHDVANQFLITDPTIHQAGFDLNRSYWTILNRYHTGRGCCAATLYDLGIRDDPFVHVAVEWINEVSHWVPGTSHC